jgi:hypothetical protein
MSNRTKLIRACSRILIAVNSHKTANA